MSVNLENVGKKIKELRNNAGLTQAQVATFLEIDQSLISKYEKGERAIQSDALDQIATLFCCPVREILSEEYSTPPYAIKFRTAAIENDDLVALSVINRIALNQFEMDQLVEAENG